MTDQHGRGNSGVDILVAEDSSTQAMSLQFLLEQQGYNVVICENGQKALVAAKQCKPTLVISDIMMPELDGYGLCRALKSDPDLAEVPVLLVTTLNDPEDVLRGLEAGADSFILKPYDDPFLLNRIRFVLLHRQLRQTDRTDMGVEITFRGRSHFITSDRLQILNLLLSTYEAAIQRNDELRRSEDELRQANSALSEANARLEEQVRQTEAAQAEVRRLSDELLKASEAQLQHSEERFRQLLDVVPAAIYATDAEGRILEYNPAAAALWGQRPEPGVDARAFYDGFEITRPGGLPFADGRSPVSLSLDPCDTVRNAEVLVERADGSTVDVLVNTAPIQGPDRRPAGAINCLIDVTELSRTQRELSVYRELAQATLDALPTHICVLDESGTILAVNMAWRAFGTRDGADTMAAIEGANYLETCRQAMGCEQPQAERFASGLREVMVGRRGEYRMEYSCDSPSEQRWFVARVTRFAFGDTVRLVVACEDITERKRQEESLARTGERLTTTLESITDGFFTLDREWKFTYVNQEGERLLQRSRAELLGQDIWGEFPDARGTLFEQNYRGAVDEQRATRFEAHYGPLGLWVEVHAYPSDEGLAVYFRDVAQRKQAELALRKSEESLRLAVTAGGLGTWRWDTASDQVTLSGHSKAIFGIDSDAAVAMEDFVSALHPEDREHTRRLLQHAVENRTDFRADFRLVRPDGSIRWLAGLGRAFEDDQGNGVRLEGVSLDITERKHTERELLELNSQLEHRVVQRTLQLEAATAEAEAANEAKSAFLATMSHEIRTPMNGIVGMVDVLSHGRLSEHQGDTVKTIRDSAFALLHLIDDVLDFSKIEAGKLDLERTELMLSELAESVCDTLSPLAEGKNVDLFLFVSPQGPASIWSDPVRVRQVLYNLVGNAIKFSGGRPNKRGRVDLRIDVVDDVPPRVRIRVADNGIGMSAEVQRNLFQSFHQAEISTTRRFGGSGLGLAICKRIVDLMGGEITVESTIGEGSVFTVEMLLDPVDATIPEPLPDLEGVDYVLVAGPCINVEELQIYLRWAGARTHVVGSGTEAARACRELPAAVIVHGIADDSSRAEWVSFFAHLPDVRHLVISRGRRRAARPAGPNVFTIDGNSLRRRSLLNAAAVAAGRASPEVHPPGEDPEEGAQVIAPTVAEARAQGRLILVAEDDPTNQKVLMRQLELLGYAAEFAGDGVEALNLWRKGGYALLLTDLHMPGLDGHGLTSAIRREEVDGRRMPILALTANALRGEASRANAMGLDEYLTKPLQLPVLREVLEKWLPRASVQAIRDPAPDEDACSQAHPVLDIEVLKRLMGDAPATIMEVLGDYEQTLCSSLAALHEAEAAGDLDGIDAIAHRLKSSSRAVGALPLGDLCAELEIACRVADKEAIRQLIGNGDHIMEQVLAAVRHHTGRGP